MTITPSVACELPGVRTVVVPLRYDRPSTAQLQLRYRLFAAARANAPTVIVVPGGPGSAIIEKAPSDAFALGAIPSDLFNVIYTDVRGSGCNRYRDFDDPEGVYSIENTARDLLAVIGDSGVHDYLLYGASFGTVQTTVAAALASTEGVPTPRRLVLEGTVGRAFASFESYFASFVTEWQRVKQLISPVWRAELDNEPWSSSLYWSREQWGTFVSLQLILGDYPGHGHMLQYWLDGLSKKDPAAQSYVSGIMAAARKNDTLAVFSSIACHELWGSWRNGRRIYRGALEALGNNICTSRGKTRPYDSKNFQSTVPITYFQGPFDPTTTSKQVRYHFDQHATVARQLVVVPRASHAPLTLGLAARGCARQVWQALDAAPETLKNTLQTCTTTGEDPVSLEEAP